jgi:hypothetical protein
MTGESIDSRSDAWKLILSRNCKKQLARTRREYPHSKSLEIPYGDVQKFGSIGLEIPDEVWNRINEQTDTDIINIVMDALNGHMGESFNQGRVNASKTMDLIAERCAAAYYEGFKAGVESVR